MPSDMGRVVARLIDRVGELERRLDETDRNVGANAKRVAKIIVITDDKPSEGDTLRYTAEGWIFSK